jgi:hypothetical protein
MNIESVCHLQIAKYSYQSYQILIVFPKKSFALVTVAFTFSLLRTISELSSSLSIFIAVQRAII